MAGEAKTDYFNLSEATLMIGPMADVFDLTPEEHSVGLIKQLAITQETEDTDLTQGVQNNIIFSVKTGVTTQIACEAYEYNAKNLGYALGLDTADFDNFTSHVIAADVTGDGATTDTFVISSTTDIAALYPVGAWVAVQASGAGKFDQIFLAKILSRVYDAAYDTLTLVVDKDVPVGTDFKSGDKIVRQNEINIGSKEPEQFYGVKIVGTLPAQEGVSGRPITIIMYKVKVTEGFNLSFLTGNEFSNMPWVFKAYDQVSSDPLYATYGKDGFAKLFIS